MGAGEITLIPQQPTWPTQIEGYRIWWSFLEGCRSLAEGPIAETSLYKTSTDQLAATRLIPRRATADQLGNVQPLRAVFLLSRYPAEVVIGAQAFHEKDTTKNGGDQHQCPRRENLAEQCHVVLHYLAPMTQLNSKLERLLSQRSFSTPCELCDLGHRRPRL